MRILPRIEGRYAEFVGPARARNELWRLAVSGFFIVVAYFLAAGILTLGFRLAFGRSETARTLAPEALGTTPGGVIFLLAVFIFVLPAVFVIVGLVHRRGPRTLFGAEPRTVLRHALIAAVVMGMLTGIGVVVTLMTADLMPNLAPADWLRWMALVLPLMAVQVTAEEVMFRGYLQQQLAARFRSPWVWMVLPSAVFGALHYQPSVLGDNAWIAVVITGLVGLFAADITARTGNLGAAIGLHFVNNFVALCLISIDGGTSGVSLFVTPFPAADSEALRPALLTDAATILGLYVIYLVIVNRKRRA
jgi:membrane protease YdiL (CAAX protease family)